MAKKTELAAAYAATTYRIYLPEGALNLRIGEASDKLARWLEAAGHGEFAVITAWNPGSERCSAAANAERQAQLACDLLEAGYECLAAENQPDGDWPVEESVFVPGMALDEALALAEDYGQLAVVQGAVDGLPLLRWTALAE